MFLSKKYCFANESEARSHFSDLLSQGSVDDQHILDRVLSTIFTVRRELFESVHHSTGKNRPATVGLPDVCITANEDYVIPAFSAQGLSCCMEIRQYTSHEIPEGQPSIHAYSVIIVGGSEWIIDVDADPFYTENIGVIIAPEKTGLYSSGFLVHKRWITASGHVERSECYTREARTYLTCEGISYVTMRYYFLGSDANQCPIVLSPYSTVYFSYSAGWTGEVRRDWIKLILVSHSQKNQVLLWNLTFDNVYSIEIRFTEKKNLHLVFLNNTDMLIPLDMHGYPLESETMQYRKHDTLSPHIEKYSFHASPTNSITLPSPFEEDDILPRTS